VPDGESGKVQKPFFHVKGLEKYKSIKIVKELFPTKYLS